MKRHPALAELSRDHHRTLVAAMRLRRARPEDRGEVAKGFLEHWEREGRTHFQVEEEVLLPAFAEHGGAEHPLVAQILVEHVVIRRDVAAIARGAQEPDLELLRELGKRLTAHVRKEENELFPLIEESLPDEALTALADSVARAEAAAGASAP